MLKILSVLSLCLGISAMTLAKNKPAIEFSVAAFNVSMEARNYLSQEEQENTVLGPHILMQLLADGSHVQIRNIAEIIQRTRPDIVLLNEFDYIDNPTLGIEAFKKNYLAKSQNGSEAIDYPFVFYAPSNTGLTTPFDLDNNGKKERFGADSQGFGLYSGHYAMVLLSKYPIVKEDIRSFQRFLWSDMPNALAPIEPKAKKPFYNQVEWMNLRLSSKSHWDVPINIGGKTVHILASHPTPPTFDGAEDRNGRRNHDEIRFWLDYVTPGQGDYIYDDSGIYGSLREDAKFVIVGDQNASPDRPNDTKMIIQQLLSSEQVNNTLTPRSEGGASNRPNNNYAKFHTASWGARADYVIPSKHLEIIDGAVFWPTQNDPLYRLVKDRKSSSDHRLVWLKLSF